MIHKKFIYNISNQIFYYNEEIFINKLIYIIINNFHYLFILYKFLKNIFYESDNFTAVRENINSKCFIKNYNEINTLE